MKRATRWGIIGVGVVGTAVGAVLGAARVIARADRRRSTSDSEAGQDRLEIPPDARHHTVLTPDGAQVHVVEYGPQDARPVLLLHGVTLTSRIWAHQLADFGAKYRVLALDWRGHGATTVGRAGVGLEVLASDLRAVITHFGLTDAVLVGHSMGGMALMRFCADSEFLREHVAKVVFTSTAASGVGGHGDGRFAQLARALAKRSSGLAERFAAPPSGDLGYLYNRFTFGVAPDASWVEQVREITDAMVPSAAGPSILALLDHDERKTLQQLDLPVLVFVGTNDRLTPEGQGRDIADLAPGAQLVVFEGGGHMLMIERRERFNTELATFVDASYVEASFVEARGLEASSVGAP